MTFDPADWAIPALSASAALVWARNMRTGLRHITTGTPSGDIRIATMATVTAVALALTWSSLLYPDLIGVEASRWGITAARISLLAGGLAVWWLSRRPEEVA